MRFSHALHIEGYCEELLYIKENKGAIIRVSAVKSYLYKYSIFSFSDCSIMFLLHTV